MKCRILEHNGKYKAQYEINSVWKTLMREVLDPKEPRLTDWFETETAAETALREFAESHGEAKVVKEFAV